MSKTQVNLIIKKSEESLLFRKLKKTLPITSATSFILFLILFVISVFYLNGNISRFNLFKSEIEQMENKISQQKNLEGLYTLTLNKVSVLSQILTNVKNFNTLISEVNSLQSEGISLTSASSNEKGDINFSVIASSSATLEMFVSDLKDRENRKLFSQIAAQGITREKKGNYILTVTLKGSPSLFQ